MMLDSVKILDALAACGRDRVFQNDGTPPMVAIRWARPYPDDPPSPEIWIRAEGTSRNEAGVKAVLMFAAKLRERATALNEWAGRLE